jgi:hypothetical protein
MAVVAVATAGVASAGPGGKSTILHCGCNETGDGMEFNEITVNRNSRGHDEHVAGSIDSCFDGIETYTDVVRTGSDCLVSGPNLRDPIVSCDPESEGDVCGTPVIN